MPVLNTAMDHITNEDPVQAAPFISDQERAMTIYILCYARHARLWKGHLNPSSQGHFMAAPGLQDRCKGPLAEAFIPLFQLI